MGFSIEVLKHRLGPGSSTGVVLVAGEGTEVLPGQRQRLLERARCSFSLP